MSILVIDDDPFVLKLIARQLQTLGETDIVTCERAADGLARLQEGEGAVGLILLDLQMPDMDGIEMVRQLTRIGYAGGLVLISGEDQRILQTAALLARAHRLQVLDALAKPVATDALRRLVEQYRAGPAAPQRAPRPAGRRYTADELGAGIAAGQLVCHFQPQVALADGALRGAESLVRWQHPTDGLVFPDQFIALAEEAGLIDALTDSVLALSLRAARAWREAGLALRISVNVSMDNLVSLDFPEKVAAALEAAGLAASQLVLEVTESRLAHDLVASLDILTRLRLRRIGLSIDDFGTGHSSFAQLRDIPFTELKIDRGFVNGAWHDATRRSIFEASLRMAKDLGLGTVAEGAEDLDDWRFLQASGCDEVQGYFVARPMPGAELVGWAARWAERSAALVAGAVPG
jgi:EAL domain-containing protein (putative c-di-GMP-specific phosphodiesterase class I)